MGWYTQYCLPHCLHLACGLPAVLEQRKKIVPLAKGSVLEVGVGSGLNLPIYVAQNIECLWALEPSEGMRKKAHAIAKKVPFTVQWLPECGEELSLDDESVDCIVLTYTLCTISDWMRALQQMRRVLKPEGTLLFCEHGEAPDRQVRKWQRRLNPVWRRMAGGCNLDRPIPKLLADGGFTIRQMISEYIDGPRIAAFNYWGTAVAA